MVIELSVSVSTFAVWFTWTLAVRSRSSSFWAMLRSWSSSCFVVASLKRKENKNNVQIIQFRCLNITSFQAPSFSSSVDFSAILREFLTNSDTLRQVWVNFLRLNSWVHTVALGISYTLLPFSRCKIELVTSLRCCDGYQNVRKYQTK